MSIIITNIDDNVRDSGPHRYVLRINNKVIAFFEHDREKGLAECLRRAATAAEQPDRQEITNERDMREAMYAFVSQITGMKK